MRSSFGCGDGGVFSRPAGERTGGGAQLYKRGNGKTSITNNINNLEGGHARFHRACRHNDISSGGRIVSNKRRMLNALDRVQFLRWAACRLTCVRGIRGQALLPCSRSKWIGQSVILSRLLHQYIPSNSSDEVANSERFVDCVARFIYGQNYVSYGHSLYHRWHLLLLHESSVHAQILQTKIHV